MKKSKIAIMISGRGSNMTHIINRLPEYEYFVISDKLHAPGLRIAEQMGIRNCFCSTTQEAQVTLQEWQPDLICLAGYMRVLHAGFVYEFSGKIINIHPSLLPAFPGLDAQQQALDHGVRWTGATVHFVTCGVDEGPIIAQDVVPVYRDDTRERLSARILQKEYMLYSNAIKSFMDGEFSMPEEGRVVRWTVQTEV